MGMGMPAEKSMNFGPSAQAPARAAARRSALGVVARARARRRQRRAHRARPEAARQRHQPRLRRRALEAAARPARRKAQVIAGARARRAQVSSRDLLSGIHLHPGPRHRLHRARLACCCSVLALYVVASVFCYLQGLRAERRSRSARCSGCGPTSRRSSTGCRWRYFDRHAARRAAQPRHQRHRQHLAVAAADHEPAADLRCSPCVGVLVMMFVISPLLARRSRCHHPADPRRDHA